MLIMAEYSHAQKSSVVLGIDVGGSTTKIVGFRLEADGSRSLMPPLFPEVPLAFPVESASF